MGLDRLVFAPYLVVGGTDRYAAVCTAFLSLHKHVVHSRSIQLGCWLLSPCPCVFRSKHYSALTNSIYRFQPVAFSLKRGDLKMIHGDLHNAWYVVWFQATADSS